jgi:hypothetical protein
MSASLARSATIPLRIRCMSSAIRMRIDAAVSIRFSSAGGY